MQEISTEKRLQLVHQIRQDHTLNRQALQTRERILYGRESSSTPAVALSGNSFLVRDEYPEDFDISPEAGMIRHSGFVIRFFIAALLFLGYFLLSRNQFSVGGMNAEVIRSEVNRYSGVEINLIDFMDHITYTLNTE